MKRLSLKMLRNKIFIFFVTCLVFSFSCSQKRNFTFSNSGVSIIEKDGVKGRIPTVDTIVISDMMFNPKEIVIPGGDTILWINNDLVSHCVTELKGMWTSSSIPVGGSWKKQFTQSSEYYCAIHPDMAGKIVVK
jgi:plastocyanin